ncbi:Acetylglutamate kinase, partial [Metarhizium majus ARSEF 297]
MSFNPCRGLALRAVAKRFSNTVPKTSRPLIKGNFPQSIAEYHDLPILIYNQECHQGNCEPDATVYWICKSLRNPAFYSNPLELGEGLRRIPSEHLDQLGSQLAFLFELGLLPIIVHGAGPQLNRLLEEANVTPSFSEGIRITDTKTLNIARKLFLEENLKLTDKLDQLGVRTRSLSGVFVADFLDKEKWGYVGKIKTVNTAAIEHSLKAGYIPVMTSMAESEDGTLLNVNADIAAMELAKSTHPMKIVYLSEKKGLFDGAGNKISQINVDAEYDYLMSQPWCKYGTRLKIKERDAIQKASSLSEFQDLDKIKKALLESQNNLDAEATDAEATVDRFLEFLKVNPFTAYYDENISGLAIILPPSADKPTATIASLTITKFGWLSNLAENMWSAIKTDNPSLCWKVSEEDENLVWFFEKANGSYKHNGGVLFYYGSDFDADVLDSFSTTLPAIHTLR